MNLREELRTALQGWNALADHDDDDQPLISSGRIDSSALFELSLWVEERIGRPIDPATFRIAVDWDTVTRILAFIDAARSGTTAPAPVTRAPVPAEDRPGRRVMDLELVRFTTHDVSGLADLQRRLWSSDDTVNRAFLEWRYFRNPVAGDPLFYIAMHNDLAVAMRGAFPSRWLAGSGDIFTWYQSDDLAVLPEYENHGIFAQFTERFRRELRTRGHRHFLSMSALRVTRMQSIAGGAHSLGSMEPVARVNPLASMLDRLRGIAGSLPYLWRLAGVHAPVELASRAFDRIDRAKPSLRDGVRWSASNHPRPAEMADLVALAPSGGRFRQLRDAAYFEWRFQSPLHGYRFLYADARSGLAGYLVLERALSDRANQRRINVADWEARSPALLEELLAQAERWAAAQELVSWTRTLGPARTDAMRRRGFRPIDREQTERGLPSVLVWPIDPSQPSDQLSAAGKPLLELDNWDLRMADTSQA